MKSLILAACVGSTVAVVAPQFPPPAVSFADAGTGMDVRPFSLFSEAPTMSQSQPTTNNVLSRFQLGNAPADFVVTDVVACGWNNLMTLVKVRVGGVPVAAFCPDQWTHQLKLQLQHGLPIQAGSLVEVDIESSSGIGTNWPVRVTLAGYIR